MNSHHRSILRPRPQAHRVPSHRLLCTPPRQQDHLRTDRTRPAGRCGSPTTFERDPRIWRGHGTADIRHQIEGQRDAEDRREQGEQRGGGDEGRGEGQGLEGGWEGGGT